MVQTCIVKMVSLMVIRKVENFYVMTVRKNRIMMRKSRQPCQGVVFLIVKK